MDKKGPSLESFLEQGDSPMPRPGEAGKTFQKRISNVNLQKSIKLLDDAVTPYVNRAVRTPRGNLRDSGITPIRPDFRLETDTEDLFLLTPGKKAAVYRAPGIEESYARNASSAAQLRKEQARSTTKPLSFRKERDEAATTNFKSFLQEPTLNYDGLTTIDLTDVVSKTEDDPTKKVTTDLYNEFKDSLKQHPSLHQVLDLVAGYESSCAKQVSQIQQIAKGLVRDEKKLQKTYSKCEHLLLEKDTWKLVYSLYKDRLESDDAMDDSDDGQRDNFQKTTLWALSEQNISSGLFEKDAHVRQSQLVVDWLETCAAENLSNQSMNAKFFVDQPIHWENTLHNLQKSKQGLQTNSRYITEMDPDAPCRQNKVLDDLDQEDERYFLYSLFILIRAGQLEKAQELCHSYGQPWRAATLEGWRLLHDPNYYRSTTSDLAPLEGNPHRDVWKAVCWRMASEDSLPVYERAVYASLSGNLTALLPACSSWADYVWAYFKVLVDVEVEKEIRLLHPTNRTLDSLPTGYTARILEPHSIFQEIAASNVEKVRLQAENYYHTLQKYFILGEIPALIEVMYSWVQDKKNPLPSPLIRTMAHIVLLIRTIGLECKKELCETIIKTYVEDLIRQNLTNLVAHYVAKLNKEDQVQMYATFLEDIGGQDERQKCLQWAEEEGLDVALITKTVVERIRMRESKSVFPTTSLAVDLSITEEDKEKIDAIEWLVFDESHRPEAVRQANAIMRTFIAVNKYAAARQAFDKIPLNSIDVIYRLWYTKTASSDLSGKDSNTIREYMCMKAYLDAVESFNDWFSLYHQGRPPKPTGAEGGSFTDRVAFEHKMKQYNQEYDRWMRNLQIQTGTTRDRIYNVLLFLDGGWLVDTEEDFDQDESRQDQLSRLRKLHIPVLCLNLHTVLHSSEMYAEAVKIADVVASEQYLLYKEFDKESLQHLLAQISKSSLALLDDNKDPLGYEVV